MFLRMLVWLSAEIILLSSNIPKTQGARRVYSSSGMAAVALFQNGFTYANFPKLILFIASLWLEEVYSVREMQSWHFLDKTFVSNVFIAL